MLLGGGLRSILFPGGNWQENYGGRLQSFSNTADAPRRVVYKRVDDTELLEDWQSKHPNEHPEEHGFTWVHLVSIFAWQLS